MVHEIVMRISAQIRVINYHWGRVPYFLLLNFLRLIVGCAQLITWHLYGVQQHLSQINKKCKDPNVDLLEFESAQIFKVLSACRLSPFDKVRRSSYLTTHKQFCRPEYVLSDKVTLTEVTPTKAIFVQMKQPIDHYTVDLEPFLYNTVVYESEYVIEMPLIVFQKLSEKVDSEYSDYWKHITFLFNCGRCGSTVIARMVQEADREGTLVLSEPLFYIDFIWYKRHASEEFFKTNLRCSLIMFLKPMCNKERVLIKFIYFAGCIAEDFHEAMPRARCIYSHRDPLQVVLAHERAFGASPLLKFLRLTLRFDLWRFAGRLIGFHRYEHVEKAINAFLKPTMFDVCLIVWSDSFRRYMEQSSTFYYPSISYDHMLANPTDFCRKLLQLVDLPEDRLNYALAALAKDSQEETGLSRDVLKHLPMTPYSADLHERADKFCDALNLPRLNFSSILKSKCQADGDLHHQLKVRYGEFGDEKCSADSRSHSKTLKDAPKQLKMYRPVPLQCLISDCKE